MQYTEHYRFKKPEYEDFADVEDINETLDQLDTKFYEQESETKTQIQKNSQNIAISMSDITKLTFQLKLKDIVDSSDMTHVIIDDADTEDAVIITSGNYENGKIYI